MARLMWVRLAVLSMVAIFGACAPSERGDDDTGGDDDAIDAGPTGPDAYVGPMGSLSGIVWMPSSAPGMVPTGQEIPVSDALVYVSTGELPIIPQTVYCDQCEDPPGYNVKSDAKGHFTLTIPPGNYQLAIQKGQFRLDQQIVVTANQT